MKLSLSNRIFSRAPARDADFSGTIGIRSRTPPLQRFIIGVMGPSISDRKRLLRQYRTYVILPPSLRAEAGEPRQRGFRRHLALFLMVMANDRPLFLLAMPPVAIVLYVFALFR